MTPSSQDAPAAVDMHCHLSECGGYRSAEADALILAVTNDPRSWRALHKQDRQPNVTWSLGLHPCIMSRTGAQLREMIASMKDSSAIGEVGLDYSDRSRSTPLEQRRILDNILSQPEAKDRIVTLHSLRATGDVVAAIETHELRGAILHWFLGSPSEIDAAISAGAYFSVNAAMAQSRLGRRVLAEIPPNRALTETDAPFARVGRSVARPGHVADIETYLAQLWDVDLEEVRHRLWSNLDALQGRLSVAPFDITRKKHG